MSLRSEPIPVVPAGTLRVARTAFPKGNLYLKMRDENSEVSTTSQILPIYFQYGGNSPFRRGG